MTSPAKQVTSTPEPRSGHPASIENFLDEYNSSRSVDPTAMNESQRQALHILLTKPPLHRIRFSVQEYKTIPDFLAAWPPSTTSQRDVAWIPVVNPRLDRVRNDDKFGITGAWDKLCAEQTPTIYDLDTLAKHYSCVSGKWLFFAPTAKIDAFWARIARATHSGTLGFSAKVAPRDEKKDDQMICVFTEDYLDSANVMKVRDGLRRLGVKQKIGYKPHVYTECRVHRGNAWGIPPMLYH
ncbi:DUF1917-domain-containing protein, partial [Athelia psychrophila]